VVPAAHPNISFEPVSVVQVQSVEDGAESLADVAWTARGFDDVYAAGTRVGTVGGGSP